MSAFCQQRSFYKHYRIFIIVNFIFTEKNFIFNPRRSPTQFLMGLCFSATIGDLLVHQNVVSSCLQYLFANLKLVFFAHFVKAMKETDLYTSG